MVLLVLEFLMWPILILGSYLTIRWAIKRVEKNDA